MPSNNKQDCNLKRAKSRQVTKKRTQTKETENNESKGVESYSYKRQKQKL